MDMKYGFRVLAFCALFLVPCHCSVALETIAATGSVCVRAELKCARGSGALPYNFRAIDGRLFAGGTLFNPETGSNDGALVRRYVRDLRARGVKTVITLHVPAGADRNGKILDKICREEGVRWLPRRMTAEQVPDDRQTAEMLAAIDAGAYVHCQWGCDRTGAVIAKYLRARRGWKGIDAWKAVISGGSHAGPIGGFKQKPSYALLVTWFWPEVTEESPEACALYGLKYTGGKSLSERR